MRKRHIVLIIIALAGFIYAVDPGVTAQWQKTLKYGISSQRMAVIQAIADNKAVESYSLIDEALVNDLNAEVRASAAFAMVNLKRNQESVWLKALSAETNLDVLRKVVYGISELKIKTAGPKLNGILTNYLTNPKSSLMAATIIRALGDIEYKAAAGQVNAILSNISYATEIRAAAAVAIATLGTESDLSNLQAIVANPGEAKDVRMYSAYAIGKTGSPKALVILKEIISDETEDLNIRLWAIAGLAFVKDKEVSKYLIEFAKVDNVRIRIEAVKALGKLQSEEAKEILFYKMQFDPDYGVKVEAKKALQAMGVDLDTKDKAQTSSAGVKPSPSSIAAKTTAVSSAPSTAVKQKTATSSSPAGEKKPQTKVK